MIHTIHKYFSGFCIILSVLSSCQDDNLIYQLDQVKSVGNDNPILAMQMYDSIRPSVEASSEYVHMKGIMLEMRLRDKAYINATSSDSAKLITAYFNSHGKGTDAAEAYYYAGSAYRDLNDMPNALKNYLKAEEILTSGKDCDSLLLRNIYSNLAFVYYGVQDYYNSLNMALKEYEIGQKIHELDIITILRVGICYLRTEQNDLAYKSYIEALDSVCSNHPNPQQYNALGQLLYELSYLRKEKDADRCFALIQQLNIKPDSQNIKEYYRLKNKPDSAILCCHSIIKESDDQDMLYGAYKDLYYIHRSLGNKDSILKYADLFIKKSGTIEMGKRQKLAATVNNQYHYYRNIAEEAAIKEENARLIMWGSIIIGGLLALVLLIMLYSVKKKQKHLKRILQLTQEIEEDGQELKEMEQKLLEKKEQNKLLIQQLHKSELDFSEKDLMNAIEKASEGRYQMTKEVWQAFYHAVDKQKPNLYEMLMAQMGQITESQKQICYLKSIGLSNTKIENITRIPHSTLYRMLNDLKDIKF